MSHFFVAIFTAIVISVWMMLSKRTKPAFHDDNSGVIKPGKTSAVITVLIGLIMATTSGYAAIVETEGKFVLFLVSLLGLAVAGFMSPSLGAWHDVEWDENGITGPCKMFGPSLSRKRTTLLWSELSSSGMTATQYWYV